MKIVACSFAILLTCTSFAQPSPCGAPEFRVLDFWVGDWDVTTPAGAAAGTSHVERILDGCVVMEHYKGARGPYEGMSFNAYDAQTKRWTQHYVDNGGLDVTLTGAFADKSLVYERRLTKKDGTPAITRMTFSDLGEHRVRQLVEQSTDGGKTWSVQFDLRYAPRKVTPGPG